jgi:hypothetical protein
MKSVIVNSKDLCDPDKNPTRCMSALRTCGECYLCEQIHNKMSCTPLSEVLSGLKCKPKISKAQMDVLKEYDTLLTNKLQTDDAILNMRNYYKFRG